MIIWVVCEGEPLPTDLKNGRLMRGGMFATQFSQSGANVTWWSSSYLHYEKRYIADNKQSIKINSNLELKLLHSNNAYKRNISVKRIQYSRDLGQQFKEKSRLAKKPDIIYCSWPLIDLSYEAIKYGKKHSIPVVIDVRDFWPDIFIQPFPKLLQPLAKLGVKLLFGKKTSYVMKNATAVVGVIPKSLQFAESHGRTLSSLDHVVPLAYDSTPVGVEDAKEAQLFWESYGSAKDKCIVSYIGTISNRIGDFDTLIEAAKKCSDPNIVFIFCGTGNYVEELKEKTKDLNNVVLPGYRNRAELQVLLSMSTFGLLAYRNTDDFIDSLPNKFGEYLSTGLIILTSLRGLSKTKVEENACGAYYDSADSLISTIESIKNDRARAEIMSDNALALFHAEFNASTVYKEFSNFLESLAE